jgi:hypothetical protein
MNRLLQLMKQLGADAALNAQYHDDAAAVIDRFGLSDEERAALLQKDYAAIKRLTGLQDGQFATNTTVTAYDS